MTRSIETGGKIKTVVNKQRMVCPRITRISASGLNIHRFLHLRLFARFAGQIFSLFLCIGVY